MRAGAALIVRRRIEIEQVTCGGAACPIGWRAPANAACRMSAGRQPRQPVPRPSVPAHLVALSARNRSAAPRVPLSNYPEDEGADYGTLSIAVAVGHSAADPGADLDLRRPALGQSPQSIADPPAARSNDRPPLWYYVHPRLPRRLFITLHRGTRSPFGTLLATNDLITSRNSALPLRLRPVKHFTGAKWTAAGPFLRRGGQVHGSIPPAAH